jgi:hypothetical protein
MKVGDPTIAILVSQEVRLFAIISVLGRFGFSNPSRPGRVEVRPERPGHVAGHVPKHAFIDRSVLEPGPQEISQVPPNGLDIPA